MHFEDSKTPTDIRLIKHDLAIKTPGTHERRVKHIRTVCGRDDHNVGLLIKAIHLNQQLVERLLAFVIASGARIVSLAAYRVYLVDKDDARHMFFSFFEKVTHPCCPNPDEHFHKFRSTDTIESNARLSSYCTRDQRFACARRTDQQHSLGNTRPYSNETFRIF